MAARDPDRQKKLIVIARRLFARHGYRGTSLSMIAAEAGLSKAALYHHFQNKEAIYRAISVGGMELLYETVLQAVEAAGDCPRERLQAYMKASAGHFERNRDNWLVNSALFWGRQVPSGRVAVISIRDTYEALLKQLIREGMEAGLFRPELDVSLSSKFLLSSLNQLPRWHQSKGEKTAVEVIEVFVDLFLRGVLVSPGEPPR